MYLKSAFVGSVKRPPLSVCLGLSILKLCSLLALVNEGRRISPSWFVEYTRQSDQEQGFDVLLLHLKHMHRLAPCPFNSIIVGNKIGIKYFGKCLLDYGLICLINNDTFRHSYTFHRFWNKDFIETRRLKWPSPEDKMLQSLDFVQDRF